MKTILVLYGSQFGESTTLRTNKIGLIPRFFSLVKEAPELPPGVAWHKGMFIDWQDDYSDDLEVDSVVVCSESECVEVRLHIEYAANAEIDLEWFESRGWYLSDEHPTLKDLVR